MTAFRDSFKFYKRRQPPPDLSDVHNFHDSQAPHFTAVSLTPFTPTSSFLQPPAAWHCVELTATNTPGLFCLHNVLTASTKSTIVAECVSTWPNVNTNNVSNLGRALETVEQLRWTTLGYHYDWTNKIYDGTRCSRVPSILHAICQDVIAALGLTDDYDAQAAIVNYYSEGDTLAGHVDESELELNHPLVSISLGQRAVYLTGGRSADEKPTAMWLTDGDIVVMSGAQRLVHHALPKVCADGILSDYGEASYANSHRLNISIRQVHSNE